MSTEQIKAIEASIRDAKSFIEQGDALERLRTNRDFRKVILEGYFEREAIRLVHLKANPNMQSVDSQKSIVSQMDAVGSLDQYFKTVFQQASLARKSIVSSEEMIEDIQAEEQEAMNHG